MYCNDWPSDLFGCCCLTLTIVMFVFWMATKCCGHSPGIGILFGIGALISSSFLFVAGRAFPGMAFTFGPICGFCISSCLGVSLHARLHCFSTSSSTQ